MSDTTKAVRRTAGLRWIFLIAAALLTVVAVYLGWIETVNELPAAPRSIVWGAALASWIGAIQAWCTRTQLERQARFEEQIDEKLEEQIKQATERIIAAITEKRLHELADLMEDNVRSINGGRRRR